MKVKALANNLVIDYKKVTQGDEITVSDIVGERLVHAGLAQLVEDKKAPKKDNKE